MAGRSVEPNAEFVLLLDDSSDQLLRDVVSRDDQAGRRREFRPAVAPDRHARPALLGAQALLNLIAEQGNRGSHVAGIDHGKRISTVASEQFTGNGSNRESRGLLEQPRVPFAVQRIDGAAAVFVHLEGRAYTEREPSERARGA